MNIFSRCLLDMFLGMNLKAHPTTFPFTCSVTKEFYQVLAHSFGSVTVGVSWYLLSILYLVLGISSKSEEHDLLNRLCDINCILLFQFSLAMWWKQIYWHWEHSRMHYIKHKASCHFPARLSLTHVLMSAAISQTLKVWKQKKSTSKNKKKKEKIKHHLPKLQ